MKESLLRFFLLPAYRPVRGIYSLITHPHKVAYSLVIFLVLGILYTLSVHLAYSKGLGAVTVPFLKIPAGEYYFWQRFWQIPFFFLTTILYAGTVRLLAVSVHGTGNFIDLFCLFCVSQTLPMFLTLWLPETILFMFYPGHVINPAWLDVTRQICGTLWPVILTIIGIGIIENIKWYFSILFALIASIPVAGLMVIFVR